ncbi:hypothetical protein ABEB36_000357 [Hypothenemus hampei]|uniref:Uncharacterized protein n=1 Tax=Hypothenemus hampei TaxID=57062 RepID=A0ABD1FAW9_HYPHA
MLNEENRDTKDEIGTELECCESLEESIFHEEILHSSTFTNSVQENMDVSDVSFLVIQSEHKDQSLIDNLNVNTPLKEINPGIDPKINILQNTLVAKSSVDFASHLFWPSPLSKSSTEQKRKKEKQPAVISSKAFQLYIKKKTDEKENLEKEKLKRKTARLLRAAEKKRRLVEKKGRKKQLESTKTQHSRVKRTETIISNIRCPQCEEKV